MLLPGTWFAGVEGIPADGHRWTAQGGIPMVFTLSPGEAIHIGDAVTLTVLAVEGDLIISGWRRRRGRVPTQAMPARTAKKPTSSTGGTGGNSNSPFAVASAGANRSGILVSSSPR